MHVTIGYNRESGHGLEFTAVFTSLSHIHHTSIGVDSHSKHDSREELGVPGPAQVQLVEGSAQQLVLLREAVAPGLL